MVEELEKAPEASKSATYQMAAAWAAAVATQSPTSSLRGGRKQHNPDPGDRENALYEETSGEHRRSHLGSHAGCGLDCYVLKEN